MFRIWTLQQSMRTDGRFKNLQQSKTFLLLVWNVSLDMCTYCWLLHLPEYQAWTQAPGWSSIGRTAKKTVPFRTIHIDHKGPIHPSSNRNLRCLLVIDACSRLLMVYPVTNTGAQATILAVEKSVHSFGILQSIVHDWGTASSNTDFVNWTKVLVSTLRPKTAH